MWVYLVTTQLASVEKQAPLLSMCLSAILSSGVLMALHSTSPSKALPVNHVILAVIPSPFFWLFSFYLPLWNNKNNNLFLNFCMMTQTFFFSIFLYNLYSGSLDYIFLNKGSCFLNKMINSVVEIVNIGVRYWDCWVSTLTYFATCMLNQAAPWCIGFTIWKQR